MDHRVNWWTCLLLNLNCNPILCFLIHIDVFYGFSFRILCVFVRPKIYSARLSLRAFADLSTSPQFNVPFFIYILFFFHWILFLYARYYVYYVCIFFILERRFLRCHSRTKWGYSCWYVSNYTVRYLAVKLMGKMANTQGASFLY